MNILRSLNKEQWTALVAAVLCALSLLLGLSGGVAAAKEKPLPAKERTYERPRPRSVELPADRVETYIQWKDIFAQESTSRLPVPYLRPPEPREEEMAAPPLRPGPATAAYNKEAYKLKYPVVSAAAPVVPASELPAAADLDALKKLAEPVVEPRKDRRHDKEREFFSVKLKNGTFVHKGNLLSEIGERFVIQNPENKNNINRPLKAECDLTTVLYADTYEKQHQKKSSKIQPGPKEAAERTTLGKWAFDLGMIPEAKQELDLALKAKPDHADAILLLGQIHQEAVNYDAAISAYQAGIDAGAQAADLHYEIGRCLRAVGFIDAAAGAFERAIDVSPRHVSAKLALARAALDLGHASQAAGHVNDVVTKLSVGGGVTEAHRTEASALRGLALLRMGTLDKAKAELELVKPESRTAEIVNALGVIAVLEGNTRDAVGAFAKAIGLDQYHIDAWLNLGTLLLLAAKPADAEAVYAAAAQRDPASADAVVGQGIAQVLSGNVQGMQTLARALSLDPRHVQANAVSGLLRLRGDQVEEALRHFTAALRGDFQYLPAYSGAAATYLRSARKLSEDAVFETDPAKKAGLRKKAADLRVNAVTLLSALKDFDPSRAGAFTALGSAYAAMDRSGDATLAFQNAASILSNDKKPADPLVSYGLGYVEYYFGGETDEKRLASSQPHFEQGEKLAGTAPDAVSARIVEDCKRVRESIEEWLASSVRFDEDFEREGGKNVGRDWIQVDGNYNVAITLERFPATGGRAKFSGRQAIQQFGITTLSKEVPSESFHSLEATFYPEKVEKTEFGLSIYTNVQPLTRSGFHVGVDANGKVRFNANAKEPGDMDGKDMSVGWTEIRTPLPNPKEITLRVVRSDRNRQMLFSVWFRDPAKSDWVLAHKDIPVPATGQRGASWQVSIFGRAWREQEYTFFVDNVRVLERTPK